MNNIRQKASQAFDQAIEHLKTELSKIRTGRANPAAVEEILVDSYGVKLPIKQMATISVPEARCITIQPWDKNQIKEIEKAITTSDQGFNPVNEGELIRIVIPTLTEEARIEITKKMNEKLEQTKITIRQKRDALKEEIQKQEKDKHIGEDEKFTALEELDKVTKEYNDKIKEMGDKKEKEIMSI
ncbi:MAG: ribosome recycling factor [Candidatus Buchananbacteria bacterium CG10_big_fil_rev_8_21_14_0_10_42_9]|uniref:Ribosome-recycling factor n=1 Tax=Candidatus Buchananbacteria bacterium CG10_big_fil_rev_8_21_14_0_10_42_9 TaxID=1974526 RepID=A0A2H0W2D2_9BACT|nr:MAG: ribosome recycling factor [Candidatus Buchananbacteria bacterium CG10_big_fil_rev_8_21_14_0_10_42_9]